MWCVTAFGHTLAEEPDKRMCCFAATSCSQWFESVDSYHIVSGVDISALRQQQLCNIRKTLRCCMVQCGLALHEIHNQMQHYMLLPS